MPRLKCDESEPIIVPYVIVVDGREKAPYRFQGIRADAKQKRRPLSVRTEWGFLESGDYSIAGFESRIAIERKSLADLYATLGSRREQFQAEHERLAKLDCAAVMIEAPWRDILRSPPPLSRLVPKTVFRTMLSWTTRYRVPWIVCESRRMAEVATFRMLDAFFRRNSHVDSCIHEQSVV